MVSFMVNFAKSLNTIPTENEKEAKLNQNIGCTNFSTREVSVVLYSHLCWWEKQEAQTHVDTYFPTSFATTFR